MQHTVAALFVKDTLTTSFRAVFRTAHRETGLKIVEQCYRLVGNDGCDLIIISDDKDFILFCILLFPVDRADITVLVETTEALQIIRESVRQFINVCW